ncbi:MAG TPA: glycine cleavage system protein H [Thermoanaerobaculia bacterium]|nr:glycine cleavage system protein H [Thermoanaerobaculia bacterium]
MEALLTILEGAVIFAAGLLIRLLLLIAFVAIALAPILAAWGLYRVVQRAIRKVRARRLGLVEVDGLVLAERRRYTPGHAWLDEAGDRLRVGLDGLAGHLLHGVTAIQLPQPGSMLAAGRAAVTIACGARTAVIPSPVTGTVMAVNSAVLRRPSLVESSPYGRGWLFSVRPASDTYRGFPTGAKARAWFHADETRLAHFLEGELGLAAADGGELVLPPPALLSEDQWHRAVSSFLAS